MARWGQAWPLTAARTAALFVEMAQALVRGGGADARYQHLHHQAVLMEVLMRACAGPLCPGPLSLALVHHGGTRPGPLSRISL